MSKIRITLGFHRRRHYNGVQSEPADKRKEAQSGVTLSGSLSNEGRDDINQERFDQLLDWLDRDREKAATKYEIIRKRLIKIFECRGVCVPDELADNTINRVARKLPEIRPTYVGEPANFFHGVAIYIFQEWLRKQKVPAVLPPQPSPPEEDETSYACLQKCAGKLPEADRDMLIAYYQEEKHAKIDHRKRLAEQLRLSMNALRIRTTRLRESLRQCVEQCLYEATAKQNERRDHS